MGDWRDLGCGEKFHGVATCAGSKPSRLLVFGTQSWLGKREEDVLGYGDGR